ncbi:IS66 family transposase [Lacipirellula limnantheis]|uniref:Transposase IS66 family protein n=1 Tax=Lacipirellula limnantheis TaxID=2528024 RepID=A0A517U4X3_9BACT|nr:transposase [Lacipirellula limnantheis]QDT75677.1 Transposase IS66 family protein [Lacipirellula limnantheis]
MAWHGQRSDLRQQHALPLLAEFRQWLQAIERSVLPESPIGQALQYMLPSWDGLVRCCANGAPSIDNNRSVRPVAIGRKSSYDFLSTRHAQRFHGVELGCNYVVRFEAIGNGFQSIEAVRNRAQKQQAETDNAKKS